MLILAAALLTQSVAEPPVDWDKEFGVEEKMRDPVTGELPVDPYVQGDGNAGAKPFDGEAMADAFGGQAGIRRIANRTVELSEADPRIAAIFASHDMVRLKRTLFEQFCYILNAGCTYTGRDMTASHKDLGVRTRDMNAATAARSAPRRRCNGRARENRGSACRDWTTSKTGGESNIIKGGSFLCAANYCARYRPAARQFQERSLGTDHIGFRLIDTARPAPVE